jgi:hypothetical protein
MKKVAGIILILIQVLVAAGEGLCIILAFVNSETIKKWGDLLSPDKNFERLTPGLIAALRIPSLAAGILFLALGIFVFSRARKAREIIQGLLASLVKLGNRFVQDGRTFFRDAWQARPGRVDSIILCVTVIIAAIARLLFINRTIEYDEAYTFAAFARYGFRYIASTYYVPNNQIFHTILVRVSTLLFGDQVWAIRLPTFIASLFLILFIYFLGRALYNRAAGITAAVIVAFLPDAVIRSVSARGYVIVTLMAVLAMLMATYVLKKRNILAWTLLVVFCALGFYTIPMMLYPCGLIFVWLLLAGVNEKTGREYGSMLNWIMYVFIAGALVAVLTILLYAPILLNNDLAVIYQNNRVLQPLKLYDFLAGFPLMLQETLQEWAKGISPAILGVILGGAFLSVFFDRKTSRYGIPMILIFIVYVAIMVLVQRPFPIPRIWLWMVPLLATWCGVGIAGLLQWLTQRSSRKFIPALVSAILLIGFAVNGMFQSYVLSISGQEDSDPLVAKVTGYLKPILNDDSVVVSGCSNARYWYYFYVDGIPDQIISNKARFFDRVFIIAYTQNNRSCRAEVMESVFSRYGPNPEFFDMHTVRVINQIEYATIYEIDPILSRIENAYPNH